MSFFFFFQIEQVSEQFVGFTFCFNVMVWQALSISKSLAMAKASAAQGKTGCKELKDMIISEIVGAAGRIDYVEVSIIWCTFR